MSYVNFDHVGWVERNNHASNRCNLKRRGKMRPVLPEHLNPFHATVINIVGTSGGGIYNAPICSLDRVAWVWGFNGMSLTWRHGLCTWDGCDLTLLVFLCHAARIRLEVNPCAPNRLRLAFFPRVADGSISRRHPDLMEAVASFNAMLPDEHPIRYAGAPVARA